MSSPEEERKQKSVKKQSRSRELQELFGNPQIRVISLTSSFKKGFGKFTATNTPTLNSGPGEREREREKREEGKTTTTKLLPGVNVPFVPESARSVSAGHSDVPVRGADFRCGRAKGREEGQL